MCVCVYSGAIDIIVDISSVLIHLSLESIYLLGEINHSGPGDVRAPYLNREEWVNTALDVIHVLVIYTECGENS